MSEEAPTESKAKINSSSNQAGNVWNFWEAAQNQAKELAMKAQILAEQATKVAQEKAADLAHKASEMSKNYDFEVASSAIMSSIGSGPLEKLRDHDGKKSVRQPIKAPLDLVYITENVVSMAFPIDLNAKKPTEAVGGNDIRAVSLFLKRRHQGHFMIWNISEESYDYSMFADQVLEYKFPGHPAPPLGLLFKICTSIESWLDADEKNIAIAHCLTGKGRTAALLACVLTWIGEFATPIEALQYIADRRRISVDTLTIPSQRRYLQYFSNMLDGVKPRSEPLLLRRIIISTIPVFGSLDGGSESNGCCPYIQLFKCGKLMATAAPSLHDVFTSQAQAGNKTQLKWVLASEGSVSFSVDCPVQGDILLRCRHADPSGARISMFRAAFHTGYVPCGVLRLTKAQLDGANSDSIFDDDFFIDLIFAPIEKASSTEASQQPVGVPSDSGLVIEASSTDRYESSLHRDSRFWDAVSARKLKSKKRRSRRFLSESQEQFSIGDDFGSSEDFHEIKFGGVSTDTPPAATKSVSSLTDEELILQLTQAHDEQLMTESSKKMSVEGRANVELQALEDLEKELGLDDLNLFKSTAASVKSIDGTPAKKEAVVSDEDNLDELEKYLQSLNP